MRRFVLTALAAATLGLFAQGASAAVNSPVRLGDVAKNPSEFTAFMDHVYFAAQDPDNGRELWRTDGTPAGTERVTQIAIELGSSAPSFLTVHGDHLYFSAGHSTSGNRELWRIDASLNVEQVKNINQDPENPDAGSDPQDLFSFGPYLYFTADDGMHGRELWRSDGSAEGTFMLADSLHGPGDSWPRAFTPHNGLLYYFARVDGIEHELWRTDGTTAEPLDALNPGSYGEEPEMAALNGRLIFSAGEQTTFPVEPEEWPEYNYEVWQSDGTPANTSRVADIRPGDAASWPRSFTVAGGQLFFMANDGATGNELWRTAGTAGSTARVRDIRPGIQESFPHQLTAVGQLLYFAANDGGGIRLWRTTEGGVDAVKASDAVLSPAHLVGHREQVYFSASATDGSSGRELWRTDAAGATQLFDLNPGPGNAFHPWSFSDRPRSRFGSLVFQEALYFPGDTGNGFEPWRLDLKLPEVPGTPGPGSPGGPTQPAGASLRFNLSGPLRQVARGPRVAVRVVARCSLDCTARATGTVRIVRKVRRGGKTRTLRASLKLTPARRGQAEAGQRYALVLRLNPKQSRRLVRQLRSRTARATARLAVTARAGDRASSVRRNVRLISAPQKPKPK